VLAARVQLLSCSSCPEVAVEVPDSIERELILPVPPARVWTALTRSDQLSAWFGTQATIDLRPGGEVIFTWDGSTGLPGTNRGVIEAVDPPNRFAFRWQSSPDTVQMTRVEFMLEPHPEGTRLRLVESGFASLPPELRGRSHEGNTIGWQRELGELAQYLAVR
jgi:uncharacterized protein YndB with AHSA1/START domain